MEQELEIYIHIPFCIKKCGYCDFLSEAADTEEQEVYIAALCREIKMKGEKTGEKKVSSVFFGGGTPSVIEPELIGMIMKEIEKTFRLDPLCEITIEANPGTLSGEKLKKYKQYGINRLSIGLHSVYDEELKLLGRIHRY